MTRIVCLAIALTALAACDSAAPTETPPTIPPGEAPSLAFVPPAGEAIGEEDGRGFALALASLFSHTGDVGTLTYTASSTTISISARVEADSLRIALLSAGTGNVSVTARSASGATASGTIPVRSTGRCPAAVPAGRVSLIPDLAAGDAWRFAIDEVITRTSGTVGVRVRGPAVLTFGAPICANGVRTQPVTETIAPETSSEDPYSGVYRPYIPRPTSTQSYTWVTTDTTIRTTAQATRSTNERAIPPFGPDIPRSVEVTAFASGRYVAREATFELSGVQVSFGATIPSGDRHSGPGSLRWIRALP